jgi:glycosyltransferase 2 family protein
MYTSEVPPRMESIPAKRTRRKIPHWLIVVLTYAISIASLLWALRGYDFSQIQSAILSVKWGWVLVAVVLDLAVYVVQAWRWLTLLRPIERLGLWETAHAIFIGLFASGVLPLRPGEIIRCYLLSVWGEIPFSLTLTAAAIERVLDGIFLVVAFWVCTWFVSMPRLLLDGVRILAVLVLAFTVLFIYVLFHRQHAHSFLAGRSWGRKFLHVLDQIHEMGNRRTLAGASGITFLYWFLQVLSVWALFLSYDMDLSIWHAWAVTLIKSIGTAIPSAPGNIGVFQSMVKLALTIFNVEPGVAVELSVLMWVVMTLPLLIAGVIAVFLTGSSLREIHHHAHHPVTKSKIPNPES